MYPTSDLLIFPHQKRIHFLFARHIAVTPYYFNINNVRKIRKSFILCRISTNRYSREIPEQFPPGTFGIIISPFLFTHRILL